MSVPSPQAGGTGPRVRIVGGDDLLRLRLRQALGDVDADLPTGTSLEVRVIGPDDRDVIEHGPLVVDRRRRTVTSAGTIVNLTAREFDLLAHLAAHPHRVFTRQELLTAVWDSSTEWQQARTVDEHVHRLRRKLGERWVATVRGVGYRFEPAPLE